MAKYKDDVESAAGKEVCRQVREELKAEVIAEDHEELVNGIKQKRKDDQKAVTRKEIEDEYDMMLSRTRMGRV